MPYDAATDHTVDRWEAARIEETRALSSTHTATIAPR